MNFQDNDQRCAAASQEGSYPRFRHDCSRCVFLGVFEDADLYACKNEIEATVIARFSDEGGNYSSGIAFGYGMNPLLTEARRRANRQGILPFNLKDALRHMPHQADESLRQELAEALLTSEIGVALRLLSLNAVSGTLALRAIVDAKAQNFAVSFPDKDFESLRDWVRTEVNDAWTWTRLLGYPCPDKKTFTEAIYQDWAFPPGVKTETEQSTTD